MYSKLILEDHSESLTINHIYEKTIHHHKETLKLKRFTKEVIKLVEFKLDQEMNKSIEQKIRELKIKSVEKIPSNKKIEYVSAFHGNGTS